ncbi:cell division protein FtsK, partial [Bacillus cereus]|nr:cell division protein FtsK [Bacillus cereus]
VYDTSTKYSIAISKNDYDDITVHDATTDFLFIRETLDEPFKINVYEGNVFHNYSKLEGTANLEAVDHLYFDGVTIQIGREDVQIFAAETRVESTLPRLLEADSFYHDEYP